MSQQINVSQNRKNTFNIAFCGLMTAVGVIFMMLGGMVPVFTYCSPLLASMVLVAVIGECGRGYALMVYIATAILSLIVSADKEAAVFYVFFGNYPVLKLYFERIRGKSLKLVLKTAFFALVTFIMYWLLMKVFRMEALLADFAGAARATYVMFFLAIVLIMDLYDFCLNSLAFLYIKRLRPIIRRLLPQ